jgi:HlyD family secretion protein
MTLLALGLLTVIVAGIAFSRMIFGPSAGAPQTTSLAQDQAEQSEKIAALGRIEPWSEIINLGAGAGPDRLESLFVERGDLVKRGEVIGYVGGYAEQIAQRDLLRAQLDEAKARMKAETALNLLRIKAAELSRRRVIELSPYRIAAQDATVGSLEARKAHEKDIQAAREHLSELKQQFEIDKVDAATQIDLARATLDRMQAEFPIASLERQIALAEARAKRMALYAPCDCRVLNIRIKPGEEIGAGPVMSIGDTDRMRAVAEVYETDIAKVRPGQKAVISSRALPTPINGKVARVGNMIFKNDVLNVDPAARADARVVEVWIDLEDTAAAKRLTNLTVDVLITTSQTMGPPPRS